MDDLHGWMQEWLSGGAQEVADELMEPTDRGTVVLAAAWLEDGLRRLLAYRLSHRILEHDEVEYLVSKSCLRSADGRVKAVKDLGLLDERVCDAINEIRSMRNDWAHGAVRLQFTDGDVERVTGKLGEFQEDIKPIVEWRSHEGVELKDVRLRFVMLVAWIYVKIGAVSGPYMPGSDAGTTEKG